MVYNLEEGEPEALCLDTFAQLCYKHILFSDFWENSTLQNKVKMDYAPRWLDNN